MRLATTDHVRVERRERLAAAGQWLRAQREKRGLSARQVADRLGVLPQTVYSWEAGKTGVDDDARAEQIAELFGVSVLTARRNLGLWVPDEGHTAEADRELAAEIAEIRNLLNRATRALEQLQAERGDAERREAG